MGRLVGFWGFAISIITTKFLSGACWSRTQIYFEDSMVRVANPIAVGVIPNAGN